ncbi:MAG: di-heme oxidoredictase family protein, partial [Chloroflexota bacterium]
MPSIRQSAAILLAFSALLAISGGVLLAQQTHNTELLGGPTTIYNDTQNAFTFPAPGIDRHQRLLFFVGDSFFNQNWVIAPASTTARDGIGPLFASRSCAGCHFKDGRGRAPDFDG